MTDILPADLNNISGIGKQRILQLRQRVILGLMQTADQPITKRWSRELVPFLSATNELHDLARRELGDKSAPAERRYR